MMREVSVRQPAPWLAFAGVLLLSFLVTVFTAHAVTINPGDILIADESPAGGSGAIIRVDPVTGAQISISSATFPSGAGFLGNPQDIVIDANGDLLVADFSGPSGFLNGIGGGVIRIDPTTGAQTVVSSGGLFGSPRAIAIDASGDILVPINPILDAQFGRPSGVIRVNPQTGAQTAVSSGGLIVDPIGIAIESNGDILVTDSSGIIEIDPITGAQTLAFFGGFIQNPRRIAIDANDDILVTNADPANPNSVIRIDPQTGNQKGE